VKDRIALRKVLAAEVEMMKHFRHANVIRYYGQFYSRKEQEMQIVLEYIEGGSVSKLLQLQKRFTEEFSARVMLQCLQGLSYLHANNIIHRDFKPDNILISRQTGKGNLRSFLSSFLHPPSSCFHVVDSLSAASFHPPILPGSLLQVLTLPLRLPSEVD
jgi:serine/threonine protein kinase